MENQGTSGRYSAELRAGRAEGAGRSTGSNDLVAYDFSKHLDAIVGEGEGFGATDIMGPQHTLFRRELVG